MKRFGLALAMLLGIGNVLTGCQKKEAVDSPIKIELSVEEILVNGKEIATSEGNAVYAANDIIFYLEGQGIAYGEGTAADEHFQTEADVHTVVHITEPGDYEVCGKLSAGQIMIDLGKDADEEEDAVVNLILNNADITCTVAPAILFLNVYECGNDDPDEAEKDVDLTKAGANLILADGSVNHVSGSYVAKIYEEDSVELSEDGRSVKDAKKLYKFDGAVYSKRSMNVYGDGELTIDAENEGLCSDLHMTIHGGYINIYSGNDGINTSEDEVSVFTMNGGNLMVEVTGETGEGDGIDSNGWLLINGGTVFAYANSDSQDSGIDSDMGIHINGGTVVASGNMMDRIEGGGQEHIVFMMREKQTGGEIYQVKDSDDNLVLEVSLENAFQMLVVSDEDLKADDTYTLWLGDELLAESSRGGMMGGPGGFRGGRPGGMQPPEGFEPGERLKMPQGMEPPVKPEI